MPHDEDQTDKPVQLEAVSEIRNLLKPETQADPELQPRKQFPSPEALALAGLSPDALQNEPPPPTPSPRPPGRDSVETVFLDYLERSQQYSEDLEQQQRLQEHPLGGTETEVFSTPKFSPKIPPGTTKTDFPPLPANFEELKKFTGWSDPGFLESFGLKNLPVKTVDALLKLSEIPANTIYNYLLNVIPATTEDQKAARETLAKLVYLGLLVVTPVIPGAKQAIQVQIHGVKALNRAAKGKKLAEQVARRAAEIAR